MKAFWDERYSHADYAYGETPNEYFKYQLAGLTPGKILMPAEGEGRNAAYAASLGWDVDAFDISTEGKRKADALAGKQNVKINYLVGECAELSFPKDTFDAIGLIYAHFPTEVKSACHRQLMDYLKPGGMIIFEAFSKKHIAFQQENPMAGGPRDLAMLFDIGEIQHDFPEIAFTSLEEEEIDLREGKYHSGKAMVIRFTGKKR
jgi:SAM-dependent methyltransferase